MNLDSFLRKCADSQPDTVLVVDERGSYTAAQIDAGVNRLAHVLAEHGVGKGDVVSWQLPNCVEGLMIHFATLRVGGVSNPIVPIYREREVSFILQEAAPTVAFAQEVYRRDRPFDRLEKLVKHGGLATTALLVDDFPRSLLFAEQEADGESAGTFPKLPADAPALLLYTSGTTADPKGVIHTHETLRAEDLSVIEWFGLQETDRIFMPSPISHITGVLCGMHLPTMLRSSVVLMDAWEPARAYELVVEHGCTWTIGATPFLQGLADEVPHGMAETFPLQTFVCGGADVPPSLVISATEGMGALVCRMYGSSEHPSVSSGQRGDSLESLAYSDGSIMPGNRVRIVTGDGTDVPPGETGEVLLHGPEQFIGYWNPERDAEAFTQDGWFRSGDLGRLSEAGLLTIEGRLKDIILRGGENISAKEVEEVLAQHPAIRDVAVVAEPHPKLTERVCAFVVLHPGGDLTIAELDTFCREAGLARQKTPERLEIIEDLPRTASGKIQKHILRDDIRSRPTAPDTEAAR